MKAFSIMLSSINDVKLFVNAATLQRFDIDVISGRYTVDAKSIMGLFSLDLASPIRVEVYGTDEEADSFKALCAGFLAD